MRRRASTSSTSIEAIATGSRPAPSDNGLEIAPGQQIAVFDADFIPKADILTETMNHFSDPKVGMVQTRWAHLNRDDSLLT